MKDDAKEKKAEQANPDQRRQHEREREFESSTDLEVDLLAQCLLGVFDGVRSCLTVPCQLVNLSVDPAGFFELRGASPGDVFAAWSCTRLISSRRSLICRSKVLDRLACRTSKLDSLSICVRICA